jgi:hypothetical protein
MSADDQSLVTGWGAQEPIDDSVLRRFVFNQADVVRAMASGPAARHAADDDVVMVDSGGPVPYDNMAVLLRPVTRADDPVLDRITGFYADATDRAALLLSVWPLPDLSARGLVLGGHPMFVVRAPGPVTASARDGVEVRDVTTVDDLRVLEQVAIEGYPIDEAAQSPPGAVFPDALLDSDVTLRLGLVDGQPVAGAAALAAHGVVNLCFAATLPAGRRRGVWSGLVWARVGEAPDQPAVAFTSDDSRPGFVRMGFLPVTRFTLMVRPPVPTTA